MRPLLNITVASRLPNVVLWKVTLKLLNSSPVNPWRLLGVILVEKPCCSEDLSIETILS
nr:MAG TPA: hypothetical protein [Caudoviricetes sp.]DAY37581.1 MAG TPA: hypothetical protein [Caudoviricetes sp.]